MAEGTARTINNIAHTDEQPSSSTEHSSEPNRKRYRFHRQALIAQFNTDIQDEEEEEDQTFGATVIENGKFISLYKRYSNVSDFLRREECIHLRAINISKETQGIWIQFKEDIDGCTVELKHFEALKMPLRYLHLMQRDRSDIKNLKSLLKKHIDLTRYSRSELKNFDRSMGIKLFQAEGWECYVGLIPVAEKGIVEYQKEVISDLSYRNFLDFRKGFAEELQKYASGGVILGTLMQNDLNDLKRVSILPEDTPYVTQALQRALGRMCMKSFRPIVFCWRFGEKLRNGLSLRSFDMQAAECTIHLAVDISSTLQEVDLLWSLDGIQQVIGSRGILGTCLSFKDSANYQSNLDGRPLDVDESLKRIIRLADVRFIQLYADTPHKKPTGRFHPVSGSILAGMCLHPLTTKALYRDACNYLTQLDTNSRCLQKSSCRLEFVAHGVMPQQHIHPKDFFDFEALSSLLDERAMVIPLPNQVIQMVAEIESFILQELRHLFVTNKGMGNVSATWKAYQYELAIEKMLWGHPLCWRSNTYSINLGPGVIGNSRCLTDSLGFVALDLPSAASSLEDSIPPLMIWTQSPTIAKAIKRASGLHDHIGASFNVIGRHLIRALLQDLYETGHVGISIPFGTFLTDLQNPQARLQIVGNMTKDSLCESLVAKRRIDNRMVYLKLCNMIANAGVNLLETVRCGFEELNLHFFPAVKLQDSNRHLVIVWSYRDSYWRLMGNSDTWDTDKEDETFSQLIKGELEKRGLVFVSKLKHAPKILPWVRPSLRRLKVEKLSTVDKVITLSLVSCIALLMGGWYIEFQALPKLMSEVPLTHKRLQELEIFSAWVLDNFKFHGIQLFKLHFTIPHKLSTGGKHAESQKQDSEKLTEHFGIKEEEDTIEHVPQIEDVPPTVEENVQRRATTCMPIQPGKYLRWSSEELTILNEVEQNTHLQNIQDLRGKYDAYKTMCMSRNVPFRTYEAFKRKFLRIQK